MKKMVSSLLMTSALLLGAVAPVVANADTQTETTDTTATFEAGDQITKPVDPANPDNGKDPDEGGNTVDPIPSAKLALVYAPKTLDFGSHKVDVMNDQSYGADGNTTSLFTKDTSVNGADLAAGKNTVVLEVSDVRGTTPGWNLTASASALTNGTDTLNGATISLPDGGLTYSGSDKGNGTTTQAQTLKTDNSAANIMTATATNGSGVTAKQMDPSAIKLNVGANTAKKGTYTGSVTWTLSDTAAE